MARVGSGRNGSTLAAGTGLPWAEGSLLSPIGLGIALRLPVISSTRDIASCCSLDKAALGLGACTASGASDAAGVTLGTGVVTLASS